jgi:hypothetical protein
VGSASGGPPQPDHRERCRGRTGRRFQVVNEGDVPGLGLVFPSADPREHFLLAGKLYLDIVEAVLGLNVLEQHGAAVKVVAELDQT